MPYGDAASLDHVHLNGDIRDVLVLGTGGGFDFDQVECPVGRSDEYVDPCSDSLEGECWLV